MGFGKYIVAECGVFILYISWIVSLIIFIGLPFVTNDIIYAYFFIIDMIGGFVICGIWLINDKYEEYKKLVSDKHKGDS